MSTLAARAVSVRRGGRSLLCAVDLVVTPGRVTMLIGPNGAGKSTLLRVLAGTLGPDAGEVTLAGRPLADLDWRELAERRAVIQQSASLAFRFTVREVVALGASPRPAAAVDAAIRATACTPFADRGYADLSGGEQARVQLARALCQLRLPLPDARGPGAPVARYLLLDEPTASLDPGQQHRMLRLLRDLVHRQPIGALVTMHDLNLASQYGDEVVLLEAGTRRAEGAPDAVLAAPVIGPVFDVSLAVAAGAPWALATRGADR